jgi:hypothetical protein
MMSKMLTLNTPRFAFVVGTRVALALGVGLLVSRRLSESRRRQIGSTLVGLGLATTVPAAMFVARGRRASRRLTRRMRARLEAE